MVLGGLLGSYLGGLLGPLDGVRWKGRILLFCGGGTAFSVRDGVEHGERDHMFQEQVFLTYVVPTTSSVN